MEYLAGGAAVSFDTSVMERNGCNLLNYPDYKLFQFWD